jgi:hypothetical protein
MNTASVEAIHGHVEASRAALEAAEEPVRLAAYPALSELLVVNRGFLDLALAREAFRAGDRAGVDAALARVRDVATPRISAGGPEPSDVRVVRRLLAVALEDRAPALAANTEPRPVDAAAACLLVHAEGRWFEPPGGERVACAGRPVLRRILVALARAHLATPGRAVSPAELLAAGWPDERMGQAAARRRLQVMMWRLRELGLRRFLRGDPDGYLLDPAVPVAFDASSARAM